MKRKKNIQIAIICILLATGTNAQDSSGAKPATTATTNPLSFSGYVEAYYSYDFDKPADNLRPSLMYSHNRHNEFNINLAFIRGSYSGERERATLALAAGTYMNANYSSETGVLKNIYEANAGYKLSAKSNLWIDAGILPSHIGWEGAVSKDCWTLTRSIAADNSPYYEGGARLSYTTNNGKWSLGGYALNGWQRITRVAGNSLMSWGTQVQFRPNDHVQLNYSTFIGTDSPDSVRKWRYFHDVFGIFQFNSTVGLTVGFDYGTQQSEKNSSSYYHWYSPVGIVRITPSTKWAIAMRVEYYNDEHGVIIYTGTANGFQTSGYSVNVDYLPAKNMAVRFEARTLHSKDYIFLKDGLSLQQDNSAITFSMALSF